MAIALSCVRCRKFIKELSVNELSKITGEEICEDCKEAVKGGFKDIEAAKNAAIGNIKRLADKYLEELEGMGRKAVKGE